MEKGKTAKKYHGSCHCKTVKFEVELDLTKGIHLCNCTYCYKTKYQKVFAPVDRLKTISGENSLNNYHAHPSSWPEGKIHHYFCKTCGVQVYSKGFLELGEEPFNGWFYAVNFATIDNYKLEDLVHAPIIYEDGLHNKQRQAPEETRHL